MKKIIRITSLSTSLLFTAASLTLSSSLEGAITGVVFSSVLFLFSEFLIQSTNESHSWLKEALEARPEPQMPVGTDEREAA